MYAIISAVINGAAAKCVLLGSYRRIEETLIVKKTLFGIRTKTHREEKRKCIVFIPYRQALKEIAEIDESQVLTANAAIPADYVKADTFTYATGETYPGEFEIRDFCGCPSCLRMRPSSKTCSPTNGMHALSPCTDTTRRLRRSVLSRKQKSSSARFLCGG